MVRAGSHRAFLRALDGSRPESIIRVLSDVLHQHLGVTHVRVLLVNYQRTALRPVLAPGDRATLHDTAANEAFTTQKPVVLSETAGNGTRAYLPVNVRGDRIGILQLTVPGAIGAERLDQLADLAMLTGYALAAAGRHTDLLHRAARSQRLTLAAELQWQLLPARGCLTPEYELAGHFEPAYAVYADCFDWSEDDDHLLVSITDAAHHARSVPLLTTLAVTAARNARRAGLDIAEQASLTDQAVYAHHQGDHCVAAIFLSIDVSTGRASGLKAGSPDLVLWRNGAPRPVGLRDQAPLGMFEETEYVAQSFDLTAGDRLLLLSDGVTSGMTTTEGPLAHERLEILDRSTSPHPSDVVRAIIDELMAGRSDTDLEDDATVVCLDWNGPGKATRLTLTDASIAAREERCRLTAVPPLRDVEE